MAGYFQRSAQRQTAAAYAPQYTALDQQGRQAAGVLHNETALNQADAEAIAQAARGGRAPIGAAFGGARQQDRGAARVVAGALGGAPSEFRAAAALENSAQTHAIAQGLAQALTQLGQQARSAQSGRMFADQAALGQYHQDLSNLASQRTQLGQAQAAATMQLASQLQQQSLARHDALVAAQAAARQQHIQNIFSALKLKHERQALDQKAGKGPKAFKLPPVSQKGVADDITHATAWAKSLFAAGVSGGDVGTTLARGGTAKVSGKAVAIPPFPRPVVHAALELARQGAINPGTAQALAAYTGDPTFLRRLGVRRQALPSIFALPGGLPIP